MGNEQSVPAPRRPANKLSKPRTNSNCSASLLNANLRGTKSAPATRRNSAATTSSAPAKTRYSFLPLPTELPPETVKIQEEQIQKKRRSLFRSRSLQPKSKKCGEASDEKEPVKPSAAEQSRSHRWLRVSGRRGHPQAFESGDAVSEASEEMEPQPLRRGTPLSQSYGPRNPRLSLVPEIPSRGPAQAENSSRFIRHDQEEASEPSVTAMTDPDTQLYVPIRRRSLLQHGVATRASSAAGTRQRLPPKPTHPEEFKFHCHPQPPQPPQPTESQLAELAALQRPPEFLGPRVETPTELDYGHIGAFKLGTLRIMNGAASPEPSLRRAATMGQEEDYISAGGASWSWDRGHNPRLSGRSNTISVPAKAPKAPWILRAESPPRQENEDLGTSQPRAPLREAMTQGQDFSSVTPKVMWRPMMIDVPDPGRSSLSFFDFGGTDESCRRAESPTKTLELAHEYRQDLATSPFSFVNSCPGSPVLKSTSKHMAVDDDLFAAEPLTPGLPTRFPGSFDSGYEKISVSKTGKTIQGPREFVPKPLAKADSGYSSNVSVRSFKRESATAAPSKESLPTPLKDTFRAASSVDSEASSHAASNAYSVRNDIILRVKRSLPALPVKEACRQPGRQAPKVSLKPMQTQMDAPLKLRHYGSDNRLSSALSHLLPPRDTRGKKTQSTPTRSSSSPGGCTAKDARYLRSMQPQAQSGNPIHTVQAFPTASEQRQIPAPIEACHKLEEQVDGFPAAIVPNTRSGLTGKLGLRGSCSQETLETIFSVGTLEVKGELTLARLQEPLPAIPQEATVEEQPAKFPSSNERVGRSQSYQHENGLSQHPPDKTAYSRRHTYQAPPPASPSYERSMGRPSVARRQIQQNSGTDIMLIDGISNSLGQSPYDDALASPPRADFKPKQQAISQERAKSMTAHFEAEAAVRFANQRTANANPELSIRARSYDSTPLSPTSPSQNMSRRSYVSAAASGRVRSRPPPAHANPSRRLSPCLQQSFEPAQIHLPTLAQGQETEKHHLSRLSVLTTKMNIPPPVSLTTQGKLVSDAVGGHTITPRSRTPPVMPGRAPPQPPVAQPTARQQHQGQQWTQPASDLRGCRNSAGEALWVQEHENIEPPLQSPQPGLRCLKSMGAYTYREQSRSSNNHYRNVDASQGKGWDVGVGVGYEYGHGSENLAPTWVDSSLRTTNHTPRPQYQQQTSNPQQEYDHSYGLPAPAPDNKEKEYYASSSAHEQHNHLSEAYHQRRTSTSDMLVLDRYTGVSTTGMKLGAGLGAVQA
ncbi:uncharacterized protein L3040_008212 [Drepanopeziza brunnea f. sp. 'multigermtubi']|uniref:uncharacterized protein n=1 Tax=Drepanopeziza brunnea f. sp. 'multigermtubi' TaxID=698441 RepID=UPI00238A4D77|nr:hypothetical protein L3040_008212 [Drepanopeziza brunnea f. sp. 'multigermtubi']